MPPSTEERGLRGVVVDQELARIDRVVIASKIGWGCRICIRSAPKQKAGTIALRARSSTDVSERVLRELRPCPIPAIAWREPGGHRRVGLSPLLSSERRCPFPHASVQVKAQ